MERVVNPSRSYDVRARMSDEIGPYVDDIRRARALMGERVPQPNPGQRWGGRFVRQPLPPAGVMEQEVLDGRGDPIIMWTRTEEPVLAQLAHQQQVANGGTRNAQTSSSSSYFRPPQWNYSTTSRPIVTNEMVRELYAPQQGKRDDEEDMFGLAHSGYSSNRVQQYRLTDLNLGPSGLGSLSPAEVQRSVVPVRYRATLGRHARSREIVFEMGDAADRFDGALQGVLSQVQGEGDLSPHPEGMDSTSLISGMQDRSREFSEMTRRTRRSDRMLRQEEEREMEREHDRRSKSPCSTDMTIVSSASKLTNEVEGSGREGSPDVKDYHSSPYWFDTSQWEAHCALQRLLERQTSEPESFVPMRRNDKTVLRRKSWDDLRLEDTFLDELRRVGEKVQRVVLGSLVTGEDSYKIKRLVRRAVDDLETFIVDDVYDVSRATDLVQRRMGDNWRPVGDYAFRNDWYAERAWAIAACHLKLFDDQKPRLLEPDIDFVEEKIKEYVKLIQGFYETTLDESLVVQGDHPYLDRIQRLAYGTMTGYLIRACMEGLVRDMIALCTRLKREEEAQKAKSEQKGMEVELEMDVAMGDNSGASRQDDPHKHSNDLEKEADDLMLAAAHTNELASRLRAAADAMLADRSRQ